MRLVQFCAAEAAAAGVAVLRVGLPPARRVALRGALGDRCAGLPVAYGTALRPPEVLLR